MLQTTTLFSSSSLYALLRPQTIQARLQSSISACSESQQYSNMSSFFCGSETDLESRFSEIIPDRRWALCYFSIMVFFLFMILSMELSAPNMLLIVVVAVCLIALILWMRHSCQQRQGDAPGAGSDLRWHSEQRVHVPPFPTRSQLSDIRIQLALLDRDFDYRDYAALRALDEDITPHTPTMSEEDISALPVHGNRTNHLVVDHHDS